MAKGFLSGMFWGGIVSVIGAGTISVLAGAPQSPDAGVEAPSGVAAPEEGGSSDASAVRDADIVRSGEAPQVASPEADTVAAAREAGSDTPVVPQAGAADDLADPAASVLDGALSVGDVSPVVPGALADAPTAPVEETELSISTDPAQPTTPVVSESPSGFSVNVDEDSPTLPIAEAPAPDTASVAQAPEAAVAPEVPRAIALETAPVAPELATTLVTDASAPALEAIEPNPVEVADTATSTEEVAGAAASVEQAGETANETFTGEGEEYAELPTTETPNVDVRPRIGRPAVTLVDPSVDAPAIEASPEAEPETETEADSETTDESAPPAPQGPAIVAHAVPFENAEDKPLMSIVLIDSGVDLTGGPVGLAALRSFPHALTFAVDASLPDANARMTNYREEGFEVMALVDLPQGATPADVEVTVSAALNAVPEAVALMEGTGNGVQVDNETGDQISQAVLASGHGLVLQSKGLNTIQKQAVRDGVPAGLVFRDFDSADQKPNVIRRFLDQAAFRAGQEGGVIMVGRVRSDTISALLLWGLQDRAERVALAPISAVLTTLVAPTQ